MTGPDEPLLDQLLAAVWMVGNMDTDEDRAAWWRTFGETWDLVAQHHGEHAQAVADRMGHRADERIRQVKGLDPGA